MVSKNIAIQFEQSEFYTLQEACDYLNLKHGISNISPKKLLGIIINYQTPIYIFCKGFELELFLEFDYPNNLDEQSIEACWQAKRKYTDLINDNISSFCEFNGLLLQLNQDSLPDLHLSGHLKGEIVFINAIPPFNTKNRHLQFFDNGHVVDFDGLKPKGIMGMVPKFTFLPSSDKAELDKQLKEITPFAYLDEEFTFNENLDEIQTEHIFLEISINDLIILHDDLIETESNIINNNLTSQTNQLEIKAKKGVSIHKLKAKEQANIIARALWNNDKDEKIKMKEMTHLVYAELHKIGFEKELPENPDTLKDWIRNIAPAYAKKGGRPKNEP